jgi:8-oxo-dGTP diphosphatase
VICVDGTLTAYRPELNAYAVPMRDGKVLVLQRKDGLWEFPGGGVEFGEHPEKAAQREMMEETAISGTNFRFIGITSATYPKDGVQKHSVYIVYSCDAGPQELKISGEHMDGRWMTVGELRYMKMGFNAQQAIELIPSF